MSFIPTIRPELAELQPYKPGPSQLKIVLSANENAYGIPDSVEQAIQEALCKTPTNRYPDVASNIVREKLAERYGVAQDQIVVGNGGDEFLLNVYLGFGGPSSWIVDTPPSFSEYAFCAELTDTPYYTVNRDANFELNVDGVIDKAQELKAQTGQNGIVILTTPNNPTANATPLAAFEKIASSVDALVLIDEAYQEFSDHPSAVSLIAKYPNIVILRTLSKAFALAGARVGYLIAHPDVIDVFFSVRQPYSVNVFSQVAARVVLEHADEMMEVVAQIKKNRAVLAKELAALEGVAVYPSDANFLFVKVPQGDKAAKLLAERYSIGVRNFANGPLTQDCLRITVGTEEENKALVAALRELLAEL